MPFIKPFKSVCKAIPRTSIQPLKGLQAQNCATLSYTFWPRTFERGGSCSRVGSRVRGFAHDVPRSSLEGLRHGVALQWDNFDVRKDVVEGKT